MSGFLGLRNKANEDIRRLLANRTSSIGQSLTGTASGIQNKRGAFLSGISPQVAQYGGAAGASGIGSLLASQKLDQGMNLNLMGRMRDVGSDSINKRYQESLRRTLQAGDDTDASELFSRNQRLAQEERDYTASEAQKEREAALRREGISEEYSRHGVALQDAAVDQSSLYEQALIRSLFGLAGAGVSAYGLSKYYNQPEPFASTRSKTFNQNGLMQQTMATDNPIYYPSRFNK